MLWDVCRIPDFQKLFNDTYLQLLKTIFLLLVKNDQIPKLWLEKKILSLKKFNGGSLKLLTGVSISLLAIYLQNQFKIINLPSEKIFQLTFLPAHFDIFYFINYPVFLILFTIIISLFVFNKNFKVHLK